MTWVGDVDLCSARSLDEAPAQLELLIVSSDGLTPGDLDRIATRRRAAPVIAVGSAPIAADRWFGPKLTSRELKQAIRELLFTRQPAASPA